MSSDIEQRLRDHYSILADELELPPSRIDNIRAGSGGPTSDDAEMPNGDPRSDRWSSMWFVAAAALVVVVGGLGVIAGRKSNSAGTDVVVDEPLTLLSSVEFLDTDDWVIATRLPDGVVYMYAFELPEPAGSDRSVWYGNERESGTTARLRVAVNSGEPTDGEPITIAGTQWQLDAPKSGRWTAVRRLTTTNVVVSDSGPFGDEDRDLLAGLEVAKPDRLPLRPLGDEYETVEVASSAQGTGFLVQESGGYWWTMVAGAGGCCEPIDTAAKGITVENTTSEVPVGGTTSRVTIGGTVLEAAVLIEVEFSDGTVAEATPTDLSGRFDRKFWVVNAVVPANQRTPVEVRSYDAAGLLLATVKPSP